jgi:hypothetical protein
MKDKKQALILLTKDSKYELKARTGTLECYDTISKTKVSIKFNKSSKVYKLLGGYSMLKPNYKNSRLIAISIDEKGNTNVLEGKELKAAEKKYKLDIKPWYLVHNNSFGV